MWFYREIKKEKNRITSDHLHFLSKLTCTKISGVKNGGCILKKNEKNFDNLCIPEHAMKWTCYID